MSKNAIIALVVGLIVGGLVTWLLLGFTDVGTTMIISYRGADEVQQKAIEQTKENEVITQPSSAGETIQVQCTSYELDPMNFTWTKAGGASYDMDIAIDGEKCGNTFTITKFEIVDANQALENTDASLTNPSAEQITEALPSAEGDTDNLMTVKNSIQDATGASEIAIADTFTDITISETLQSAAACGNIEDAGMWADAYKAASGWCDNHPFMCGMGVGILIMLL